MVKVLSVIPQDNYQLHVKLSNGKEGLFDVTPYLERGIFVELKDKAYFSTVKAIWGGVAWPRSQDFSADTLEFEMKALMRA